MDQQDSEPLTSDTKLDARDTDALAKEVAEKAEVQLLARVERLLLYVGFAAAIAGIGGLLSFKHLVESQVNRAVREYRKPFQQLMDESAKDLAKANVELKKARNTIDESKDDIDGLRPRVQSLSRRIDDSEKAWVRLHEQPLEELSEKVNVLNSINPESGEILQRLGELERTIQQQRPGFHPVSVVGTRHSSGRVGQYFNFAVADIDRIVGTAAWDELVLLLINVRTAEIGPAVLWRRRSGDSEGSGHGRWSRGASEGQWKEGDTFFVVLLE